LLAKLCSASASSFNELGGDVLFHLERISREWHPRAWRGGYSPCSQISFINRNETDLAREAAIAPPADRIETLFCKLAERKA
jgi:hypothetical protein